MRKFGTSLLLLFLINYKAYAELEIDYEKYLPISAETIKITNQGLLLGEYNNNLTQNPYNGVFFDKTGNLEFSSKILKSYKITDFSEDENFYYASSFMTVGGQQGLFKFSKDFTQVENIGVKAATRKILQFKEKVYTGGYVHGLYAVNKDGSNLKQILGDGYFGPQIDDIKANSDTIYALSRGLLYKIDYQTDSAELVNISQRPSFIEVSDSKLYISSYNKFYYLDFNNNLSNEKIFTNKITFLKKHKNLIILVESDFNSSYFWISNDDGQNFYKSKVTFPASKTIKNIEVIGDNPYTIYLNIGGNGIYKGKLNFDFEDLKIFEVPFDYSNSKDLKDKITSFFDHRYPYLGNLEEDSKYQELTLSFEGKELPKPYQYYSSHDGIDWGLKLGTSVKAISEGFASYKYDNFGLGHSIIISHPNGYISVYGHLSDKNLVTKNSDYVRVGENQKIGEVGLSGNTSGPHLHFTLYKGTKSLFNKVDPFGWNGKFIDPWEEIGSKSNYLWKINNDSNIEQINIENESNISQDKFQIDFINISFLKNPITLVFKPTPPIYDSQNYAYVEHTSYDYSILDFRSNYMTQKMMGLIDFKGFKEGDDKNYSIWRVTENSVEKSTTVYNSQLKSLSTIFEPSSQYLVLKNNYKKVSVKTRISTN